MNTWDVISYWRNTPKFDSESKISTPELLRLINLGYNFVGQSLYPIFSDDLVIELAAGAFDSADSLYAPDDALYVIRVFRETVNSSGIYKPCTKVDIEKKELIGEDPKFPIRTDYPYYVHQGKELLIYPPFPTAEDHVNIKIVYRKRLADLIIGSSTIGVAASDVLTLDVLSSRRDDIYNGYDMAIFKKDDTYDSWELEQILKVSDYVGSTRVCSFRNTAGDDEFDASTEYRYALYPFIPEEYHNFILDAVRVELIKAGRLDGEPTSLQKVLSDLLRQTLITNGFSDLVGRQD